MGACHGKSDDLSETFHANVNDHLPSSEDYERIPLVSLELAVDPLITLLPAVQTYVRLARDRCRHPADGLTCDQSASIMLLTMRWQPVDQCLYAVLNATVTSTDAEPLKRWFLYLKLLYTALMRLPSIHRTIYRGIKADVRKQYPKGKAIDWWYFTLCTHSLSVLQSEKYLGRTGPRSIITIDSHSSKDIQKHSFFPSTDMILLLTPGQFHVTQCLEHEPDLHWIQLEEMHSSLTLLQPPRVTPLADMPVVPLPFPVASVETYPSLRHRSRVGQPMQSDQNLERAIANVRPHSTVQLRADSLSNNDMRLIVRQAIVSKKCSELWLYNSKVTSQGALILANNLHNNTTLKKLYVNDNCIQDRGVYYLARALSINNSTLKELHLARNGIGSRGAQYLAEMLATNRTLKTLSLFGNKIDDQGMKHLTHALTHCNSTLECLYLSGNTLATDASVDSLVDMFKQNRTLKKLHLFNCKFSHAGRNKLREAARSKPSFSLYI